MTLLNPTFLWLLIPIAILFYSQHKSLIASSNLVVLGLIIIALVRPVWNQSLQESRVEAKDIIIALDISYSMRARDIAPSRYKYAKESINFLLQSNKVDNIMLIAFTTNPLLLSPPTTDHKLISIALESLNMDYILTHGTSLKRLFNKIATLNIENKNLILITDGGEESNIEELNKIIQNSNISLNILALGTQVGTTLIMPDGSLLKDKDDNLVISQLNPLLKQLSSQNNGTYLTARSSPSLSAKDLIQSINNHQQNTHSITKMQQHYIELYSIPLFIAILLFIIIHTRAIRYFIIFLGFFALEVNASILDNLILTKAYNAYSIKDFNSSQKYLFSIENQSLQSRIALANNYYKQKNYQKALSVYLNINSTSLDIKQQLYYNIGNCYARLEKYQKAKEAYVNSLQLKYDEDAIYNLSLVIWRKDSKKPTLGMVQPQAQNSSSSSNKDGKSSPKKSDNEESSGSGGGEQKSTKSKENSNKKLMESPSAPTQPFSSKVYELINKGYIYEKQPW